MSDEIDGVGDGELPPLAVSGPDGVRRVVCGIEAATTVGALADALGVASSDGVVIDGRAVHRRVRLGRSGIRQGSMVEGRADGEQGPEAMARRITCTARAELRSTRHAAPADAERRRAPLVAVEVEAGPAVPAPVRLSVGRHVIGRSRGAAVRLLDDAVELHHAVIDVDDESLRFTQITGRTPCEMSDRSDAGDAIVTVGASRVAIRRLADGESSDGTGAALRAHAGDPWRLSLHRTPRHQPVWSPAPIELPAEPIAPAGGGGMGLLAAALSMVGGLVVAVVMGNPMFLVFSCVGLLVAAGTRLGSRSTERRRRTQRSGERLKAMARFEREVHEQRRTWASFHRSTTPTVGAALERLGLGGGGSDIDAGIWGRRGVHDDAFAVTLGWGEVNGNLIVAPGPSQAECDLVIRRGQRFEDLPVAVSLGPGRALAVVGGHANAVVRSLVTQLATWSGPADWRLAVIADDPSDWAWCSWLPHGGAHADARVHAAGDAARLGDALARLADDPGAHVVVVTDRADLLAARTGALRRFLAAAPSVAVVATVDAGGNVPSMCTSVLEVGSLCAGRWCPDTGAATATSRVHAAGISTDVAEAAARRLAALHDPEDVAEVDGDAPRSVSLSQLLARHGPGALDDAIAIAAWWRTGGQADGHPSAIIGATGDGVVSIDLVRDGPHALIAGTTGAGKSELLRTMVVSMAANSSPDDITFVLIDYKGGSTFDACSELPHTVGVVTDLDDRLAERAIRSLDAEIRRRERLLRDAGADDLDAFRRAQRERPELEVLPRLVVVIDEFAALAVELPSFLSSLVGVAQRGRSLGIHLILATQRPTGVVNDDIRANTNMRIALRLQDRHEALDIVGDHRPSEFSRTMPGRAVLRLGPDEVVVFQTANSSCAGRAGRDGLRVLRDVEDASAVAGSPDVRGGVSELVTLTRSIRSAASLCEVAPPFRPWLEPLPSWLSPTDVDFPDAVGFAVGIVDDPAHQARRPLSWNRDDGSLLLAGSQGSGTSTALRSAVIAAATSAAPAAVYVIDARGDATLEGLGGLTTCAGVVGVYDAERRGRVIRLLSTELARRQSGAPSTQEPMVLAIDGLPALLAALSSHEDVDEHDRLVRILSDGGAAGIRCVATAERPGGVAMSILATFAQRWVFHLDDPLEGSAVGVSAALVPDAIPGRLVVVSSGLEAQVAPLEVPDRSVDAGDGGGGGGAFRLAPIEVLAPDIDACTLPRSAPLEGSSALMLGCDFATLAPVSLTVPDGEHVVILGPARSGRSTSLARVASAWRDVHPSGVVLVLCPRRSSPLARWAAAAGEVMIVDTEDELVAALHDAGPGRPGLLAIDDAERVDDPTGALAAIVARRDPYVLVACAGRADTLRTMYGHWSAIVRRSRIGLVMTSGSDADGDLLGEVLPRHLPISARRGLAWLIDGDGRRLVQVASDRAAAVR